jgi:lipopolysaccharide/colanic/teichoic acid biosynthesis glycosyltransferase
MRQGKGYIFAKRFLDISVSLFALIVLSPVFLGISLFYLFGDNRGPVFYVQRRIGQNHREFGIYKFRSMVVDAEAKLYANQKLYMEFVNNGYKLPTEADPRITRFGAFLRKTSLDEIPQFINILLGDMSVVGPRPVVETELTEYGDRVETFLSVKPGAMGVWQASGRSDIQYPERADLELSYVYSADMWFDFKILAQNMLAIVKREGAM